MDDMFSECNKNDIYVSNTSYRYGVSFIHTINAITFFFLIVFKLKITERKDDVAVHCVCVCVCAKHYSETNIILLCHLICMHT